MTTTDNPTATTPDSPEVEAFKARFYTEAMELARSRGFSREAQQLLTQLGLTGPGAATIKAVVTLPVTVSVEDVFGEGTTVEQARTRLAGYSQAQLAREACSRASYDQATVEYEVTEGPGVTS